MTSNHGSAGGNNESGDAKKSSDKQGEGESKEDKEKAISTAEDVENARISDDVDCFLAILLSLKQNDHDHNNDQHPPDIPQSSIDKLLSTVELDLTRCENKSDKWFTSVLDAVDRADKLSTALSAFSSSNDDYKNAADRSSSVLQRAMTFLEEQFRLLLEDSRIKVPASVSRKPSHWSRQDSDSSGTFSPSASKNDPNGCEDEVSPPPFPPEIIGRLQRIADVMISAGYGSECFQTFSIARHNAFEEGLSSIGFHRISVDEIKKMQWESLQAVITTWIQSFRQSISVFFPRERSLCESVFSQHRLIARSLFNNLARGVLIHLLNFAEAVTLTKASAEKLFKFLDMYEALQDMLPEMDVLFPGNDEAADLKSEISAARSRIGESAVAMFSDLENSIRADVAKSPVPGGAVHPLTSYVMNYLKYACEYKTTLEQVFADEDQQAADAKSPTAKAEHTPFAAQIISVMELLDSNLETKSKLYREPALNYIFLMNNGRYIIKKIKESAEIHEVVGDNWYRKRSSEMRQYHKSYQRETWSKALACFKDEGLKGSMLKPALKEKMKSFNAMFEEIHKNQGNWVVCDEQLKSELRVSITAVLVPAYRSFLGKYRQNLSGRQAEKHVKFGPEDIENKIDELFEGNPSNHGHGHGHGYGLGRRR